MGTEQSPKPEQTPVAELLDLAKTTDPETADGIFLQAVADGVTAAQLDRHRLDDILDQD